VKGKDRPPIIPHQQHTDRRGQLSGPSAIGLHGGEVGDLLDVLPDFFEHRIRLGPNILETLPGYTQSMVLEQENLRIPVVLLPVLENRSSGRGGQDVAWIYRGNPQHLVGKQFASRPLAVLGAGQGIDQRRMGVNHVGFLEQVVEQRLYTGTLRFLPVFPRCQQIFQDLGLPLCRLLRVIFAPHTWQHLPAQADKSLSVYVRQPHPGGFDIQVLPCLVRGVSSPGQDILGIRTVVMGDRQEFL